MTHHDTWNSESGWIRANPLASFALVFVPSWCRDFTWHLCAFRCPLSLLASLYLRVFCFFACLICSCHGTSWHLVLVAFVFCCLLAFTSSNLSLFHRTLDLPSCFVVHVLWCLQFSNVHDVRYVSSPVRVLILLWCCAFPSKRHGVFLSSCFVLFVSCALASLSLSLFLSVFWLKFPIWCLVPVFASDLILVYFGICLTNWCCKSLNGWCFFH